MTIRRMLMAVLLIFFIIFSNTNRPSLAEELSTSSIVHLRILETTDIHGHILNYDYLRGRYTNEYGLVRTSTLIKQARREVLNTLLFDNGDLLQGNVLTNYVAREGKVLLGETHPIYKAMNLLGYDAATFGNHDFHYGFPFLQASIKGANFPYVNANMYIEDHDNIGINDIHYFNPYMILDKKVTDINGFRHHLKVGVIGFVTPKVMDWEKRALGGRVRVRDITATAEELVPRMKEAGADIVIVLAHTGLTSPYNINEENSVYPLSKVPGIDAILFGHSHKVFPDRSKYKRVPGIDNKRGTINGVAAVQAGSWGSHLGLIDLLLEYKNGQWTVIHSQSSARSIFKRTKNGIEPTVKSDEEVKNAIIDTHNKAIRNYEIESRDIRVEAELTKKPDI
ncbi:metallophosphoesterase [Bacillus sp. FJAT-49736]|uniref:metallophosphoesterase n=1 Tax=Bacillus sp. FJAT-49736 TaxID=2833582 RepID=UPI001BC8EBE0|nr:metallophosphoesterase [Bacillus sp. FJAT-49736]MBS4174184.1 metallophosphoesterase [Bacillus sp. FJAT-49736]